MENSSQERKEGQGLLEISDDTTINHEVSEEFSLPDYVPEIRKLLMTRAQVLPESKYISNNTSPSTMELAGTVTYSIIYTSENGELCALPLNSSYEAKTPILANGTVFIDTSVENCQPRVTAPRKLTIKSKLKSRVIGFKENSLNESISPRSSADEIFIERKTAQRKSISVMPISLQNIRMNDRLDISGLEMVKPIWCDASIILSDVKMQNGSVSVRGDVTVKCLCTTSSGEKTITKTIPLVEEIEAEGGAIDDYVMVIPRCVSLSISNSENGENRELFFDLVCELEGEILRNVDIELTKDVYSTKNETQASYKKMNLYRAIKAQNASFTVSEVMPREKSEISTIVEIIADPVYEKTEIKGSKAHLLGKLFVHVLGTNGPNEEGIAEYLHDLYEIPIKYETDIGKAEGEVIARADFTLGNLNARYDNERFYVTAEVFPSFTIYERTEEEVLDKATIKKDIEYKRDLSSVKVCFPREGETLWDIAKKYHIAASRLAEQNGISADAPLNAKSLII